MQDKPGITIPGRFGCNRDHSSDAEGLFSSSLSLDPDIPRTRGLSR